MWTSPLDCLAACRATVVAEAAIKHFCPLAGMKTSVFQPRPVLIFWLCAEDQHFLATPLGSNSEGFLVLGASSKFKTMSICGRHRPAGLEEFFVRFVFKAACCVRPGSGFAVKGFVENSFWHAKHCTCKSASLPPSDPILAKRTQPFAKTKIGPPRYHRSAVLRLAIRCQSQVSRLRSWGLRGLGLGV